MKKLTLNLCVSLLLFSCASNFEEEKNVLLQSSDKKDLVSSFELTQEESKKFQAVEVSQNTLPNKNLENKISKNVGKKKNKSEKSSPIELKNERESEKIIKKIEEETKYDANYPESFKKYDLKSKAIWEKFQAKYFVGEQSIMAITYLGVVAGYITMSSLPLKLINGKEAYHFSCRFKSRDSYRYFYWLDDVLESFVEKSTFLPIKYSLIQREKKQNVDDLQIFDSKTLKTKSFYKRVKEGSNKNESLETFIPKYLQDSFSALQFVRGLPLLKGDHYEFPVVTRGKVWTLKVDVLGEEITSVNDKDMKAIKIKAETHFPGVLQKSGDIVFWYSADELRKFLKVQAKIKIGSIFGELVEYKNGVELK